MEFIKLFDLETRIVFIILFFIFLINFHRVYIDETRVSETSEILQKSVDHAMIAVASTIIREM